MIIDVTCHLLLDKKHLEHVVSFRRPRKSVFTIMFKVFIFPFVVFCVCMSFLHGKASLGEL